MFECIWVKIITKKSVFNVATIYHPPGDCGYKDKDLTDYLTDSCEQILLRDQPRTQARSIAFIEISGN